MPRPLQSSSGPDPAGILRSSLRNWGDGCFRDLLTGAILLACLACARFAQGEGVTSAAPAGGEAGATAHVPGLPSGVWLGMGESTLRERRPGARLFGPPLSEVSGKQGVFKLYKEDVDGYLGCETGRYFCLFENGVCTSIKVELWFDPKGIPGNRRFLVKSWLRHFGPGFRRTTWDATVHSVGLACPRLEWRTGPVWATLGFPPDLEGVRPADGKIELAMTTDTVEPVPDPDRVEYSSEKRLSLFRCVEDLLEEKRATTDEGEKAAPEASTAEDGPVTTWHRLSMRWYAALAGAMGIAVLSLASLKLLGERRAVAAGVEAGGSGEATAQGARANETVSTVRVRWLLLCIFGLAAGVTVLLWSLEEREVAPRQERAEERQGVPAPRNVEAPRVGATTDREPEQTDSSPERIEIRLNIDRGDAKRALMITLDGIPVADLDELRVRLTELSKKDGAKERQTVLVAPEALPYHWIRQTIALLVETGFWNKGARLQFE